MTKQQKEIIIERILEVLFIFMLFGLGFLALLMGA